MINEMKNRKMIEFNLNGDDIQIGVQPGETLAEVLREKLDLTGTKIGCNEAECGACTVIVDGESILSCTYPAIRADGRRVLTIEGLASYEARLYGLSEEEDLLHPLQEAFIKHGAVQCGFCNPGQIMTALAIIEKNPNPSIEDIRHGLKDTLCRCAAYPTIERAILAAVHTLNTGEPVSNPTYSISSKPHKRVGTHQIRPDGIEKVTGDALFTDDLKFDDMLFARVKRAGIPHGILRQLDTDAARSLPGVVTVFTAEDIPGEKNHGIVIRDWPSIVGIGEKVRYVGDAVAIVAAENQETAAKAIELITAQFEPCEIVDNPLKALEPDAPRIHPEGNLLKHIKVRKGDIDIGFNISDLILERTYYSQTTDHAFLEPECSIAVPLDDGRMEIYVGSQIPYADRTQVAHVLGWPADRVRVIGQHMGGGFGGKEDIAGQIHAALLAFSTGRPVKLLFDRHESIIVHPKRHATQITVKLGARKDGTIMAVKTELYGDTGAYASLGEKVMARATTHSSGPYEIPNVFADCYAMYTNNPPAGAFRGFGALQGQFAIESMMDEMAEALGMDPIELRKKNALKVGSITNTGQVLRESVGLQECIDKVRAKMEEFAQKEGYSELFQPRINDGNPHLIRSWGFAVAYKNTGLGGGAPDKAGAEVELYPNGILEVRTSSSELGQGLVSVLQIIVAEEFSISPDRVRVLVMDTDLTPDGGPTTASRQTYVTGNAALHAAKTLKQTISATLAEKFDVPPEEIRFVEGLVQAGDYRINLGKVVKFLRDEHREPKAFYEYWAPSTKPLGEGGDMHFAFSFAAQAAEVEVNTQTGEVRVLRAIAANDVGSAINPLGLQGQVEGGIVMGIGHALTENYILENGVPFTNRLARYRIPNIAQTPEIISIIVEHPTAEGPYGAKGVGEIVSIPTIPAITNAIYNAVGVRIDKLPVDQEEILRNLSI
jgi:CO/xanthine dehydrogenase Mo-binding subunit/aerobic-type carbon monoxide dehydrogenase small subunit (CoxS/CutS family)